jgi:membrane-associated HD superfamily phosphohydrolase
MRDTLALIAAIALVGFVSACKDEPPPRRTATAPASQPADSAEEVRQEAEEAFEAARRFGYEKKQEYERIIERELQQLDERIAELKAQAASAKEQARPVIEQRIAELQKRAADARQRLSRLRETGERAWDEVQQGMETAVRDLKKSFARARAYFEQTPESQPAEKP